MNDNKPISTFDEVCRLTVETMCSMDMEALLLLKKQAKIEFERAKLAKGCIEFALFLKNYENDLKQSGLVQLNLLD